MQFRKLALVAGTCIALLGQAPAGAGTLADYRLLVLDGHQLKWGKPLLGSGASVSYAIVARERQFPGARNCSGLRPISAVLSSNNIKAARFQSELELAFQAWERIAGIVLVPGDPESADILIGTQIAPRGRAFTNVSYDEVAKTTGIRSITRALICLNPTERWKIGFDGNLDVYDLRYTLMHEIGHAIGLNHPEVRGALMHFKYLEKFRTLQTGDAEGAVALYGPAVGPSIVADKSAKPGPVEHAKSWGEAAIDGQRRAEREARIE
jgi:hypothetical protein